MKYILAKVTIVTQGGYFSLSEGGVKPIFHQKTCSGWLPNANEIDANSMKSTWPMRCQREIAQCELHSASLRWVSCWVDWYFRWVRKAFWIPTWWYRQRKPLVLGAIPNAKPQREWVYVLVEYRLYLPHRLLRIVCKICRGSIKVQILQE